MYPNVRIIKTTTKNIVKNSNDVHRYKRIKNYSITTKKTLGTRLSALSIEKTQKRLLVLNGQPLVTIIV